MSCPKSSVDNQSVENAIPNQSVTAVAPGSWAYVRRGSLVYSSLVNTLPKTKKGKYTAVTEAHKEYT